MPHDEFCERLVESAKGGGKMLHQVTQPQHEDEEHGSSPEWNMMLHMEPEARLIVMSGRNIGRSVRKCKKCRSLWESEELKIS